MSVLTIKKDISVDIIENAYCFPALSFWINLYRDLHRICMHCHKAVKAPVTGMVSKVQNGLNREQKFCRIDKSVQLSQRDSFLRNGRGKIPQPLVCQSPDDSQGILL